MNVTYGSLFTGAGGFELGFDKLDWEVKWQSEINKFARLHLENRFNVPNLGDIRDIRSPEPVDVICGGFPCQDISNAGLTAGLQASRSGLFFEMVRIVDEMRKETDGEYPRAVIWENVSNLVNRTRGWLDTIYRAWGEVGAVVQEHRMVDARGFGVPQRRRRVIGVVSFDSRSERVGQILLEPAGCERNTQQGARSESGVRSSVGGGSGVIGFHLKQNPVNGPWLPALGVSSQGMGVMVDGVLRKLSPLETDRAMGWPDDWTNSLSDSQRYILAGNGLVAAKAEWAARRLESHWAEVEHVA